MTAKLSIGELAKAANVPTSTVRYYERAGILRPSGRTSGNYRIYSELELDLEGRRLLLRGANELRVREVLDEQFDQYLQLEEDGADGDLVLALTDFWKGEVVDRAVQQAVSVLERRIDELGLREPVIAPQGTGRILVQLPGSDVDPRTARDMVEKTTFLEFFKVRTSAANEELLRAQYPNQELPAGTRIRLSKQTGEAYLLEEPAILAGNMLEDARLSFDRRGIPVVSFTWDDEGTEIFRKFTAESIGERMAAVIDEDVITAPVIQSRIGKRGQIEGRFTQEAAANLSIQLRSGALPIPLKIEEERTVGPSLGQDSIESGLYSILTGGAFVIVFMIVYYSLSGALANLALTLNLLIIIGLMSAFGATLTLPGIAGLVLTVGMAVDANVIIFERIREELRGGKAMRNAIQIGFNRSRLTIFDANITTLIAAFVLLQFGRGPVQGFGVTLAIWIFSSVFCALVVTRLLVDLTTRNSQKIHI